MAPQNVLLYEYVDFSWLSADFVVSFSHQQQNFAPVCKFDICDKLIRLCVSSVCVCMRIVRQNNAALCSICLLNASKSCASCDVASFYENTEHSTVITLKYSTQHALYNTIREPKIFKLLSTNVLVMIMKSEKKPSKANLYRRNVSIWLIKWYTEFWYAYVFINICFQQSDFVFAFPHDCI